MTGTRLGDRPIRALSFDCWNTLLVESDPAASYGRRVEALVRAVAHRRAELSGTEARAALDAAWRRHWDTWHAVRASGSREIAAWALAELGIEDAPAAAQLAGEMEEIALTSTTVALEGAAETLRAARAARLRCALVCDTGFTPGRVVRTLLERAGLLPFFDALVFSDEAGVPKPHPRMFQQALAALERPPHQVAHVGDSLRTDVAGARSQGMVAIRLRQSDDDRSGLREAEYVVDSHAELCRILGL